MLLLWSSGTSISFAVIEKLLAGSKIAPEIEVAPRFDRCRYVASLVPQLAAGPPSQQ